MESVQALNSVVDRLYDWFGAIPREEIARVLREETAHYQACLMRGETPVAAEHCAYLRLQESIAA